jgi:PII-like signaling protein
VLRWLAPGEEVISNRHGQADRNRPLLKRINSGGMAEGGTVHSGSGGFGAEAAGATSRLHKMNHALDDATKSVDKEKQHRDDLVQAEKDLAKSVASNFRSDLFGQTSAWSASTPASTLKMDIANARAFNKALHELARKGVHGAALAAVAQSGDLAGAQMLAAHPGDFQHLYQLRQRVTRGLGDYAGSAVVGSELHESNHHLKQLRAEVIHLRREVKGLRKDGPKNADRTGDRTAKAINHSAAQGHRRRPKHP